MSRLTYMGATPATYDRTLLIGVGGSGIRAVRTALLYGTQLPGLDTALDPALQSSLNQGTITAVGIDTDPDDLGDELPLQREAFPTSIRQKLSACPGTILYPTIPHAILVPRADIEEAIKAARDYYMHELQNIGGDANSWSASPSGATLAAKAINEFLPINAKNQNFLMPPGHKITKGAGQLRALGRIGFLAGLTNITNTIRKTLSETGLKQEGEGLNVVIFSSLAGGTGAGMFLDLAILLRKSLLPRARISGYFLLPEVFSAASDLDRLWANAYAALKELTLLAHPHNERPIAITYRSMGLDTPVYIQKGDYAILNDIYLFDESAAELDGNRHVLQKAGHGVAAAARAMADAALAASRSDVTAVNKNKQNQPLSRSQVGQEERRIYHAIRAWPVTPEEASNLSGILLQIAGRDHVRPHLEDMETAKRLDDGLESLENLRRAMKNTKGPAADTPSSTDETGEWISSLDKFLDRLKAIFDQKSPTSLKEIEKKFNYTDFNKWIKKNFDPRHISILDSWSEQISPIDLKDHAKTFEAKSIAYQLPVVRIFQDDFNKTKYGKVIEQLNSFKEEMTLNRTCLSQDVESRLKGFLDELKALEATEIPPITIPAPAAFFRQRISFKAYSGSQAAKWDKLLDKASAGPLVDDIKEIARHIHDTIRQNLVSSEEQKKPSIKNNVMEKIIDTFLTNDGRRELKSLINEIIELSGKNRTYIETLRAMLEEQVMNAVGVASLHPAERETKRFGRIMEPLISLIRLFHHEQRNSGRYEAAHRRPRELRREMEEDVGHIKRKYLRHTSVITDIITGLKEKIPGTHNGYKQEDLAYTIANTLGTVMLDTFKEDCKKEDFTDQRLKDMLDDFQAITKAFLDVWLRQPEFELARLGGETGIREIAERCILSTFVGARAPGEFRTNHVTVALPALDGHPEDVDATVRHTVHRVLQSTLGAEPMVARERSEQPIILHEKQFYAAFEIRSIQRYHDRYRQVPDDQRALYHVMPGGDTFPDLERDAAILDPLARDDAWLCYRHEDEPRRNPIESNECLHCLREYHEGKRRFIDVGRQSVLEFNTKGQNKSSIYGVTSKSGYYDFSMPALNRNHTNKKKIPYPLEKHFLNGPEDHERSFETGKMGRFEMMLREQGFSEEIPAFTGTERPDDQRVFPAVFNHDTRQWEWVARSARHHNRFVRFDARNAPLYECFHCGFPTPIPVGQGQGQALICPRCGRHIRHCATCSDNPENLFFYMPLHHGDQSIDTCPKCGTDMDPGSTSPIHGGGGNGPNSIGGGGGSHWDDNTPRNPFDRQPSDYPPPHSGGA